MVGDFVFVVVVIRFAFAVPLFVVVLVAFERRVPGFVGPSHIPSVF